jgi:transposase
VESDPTRMCALLVGLPDVAIVGVGEWPNWLRVEVASVTARPLCWCGAIAHRHGVRQVVLVDLPCFGRATRLVVHKQRWRCPRCRRSWTEQNPAIASSRCAMTTRAARWATVQVGRHGRAVSEVAADLGCDWHTVMDAVVLFGEPLIDDPARYGVVSAVGLDETLYVREGRYRRYHDRLPWSDDVLRRPQWWIRYDRLLSNWTTEVCRRCKESATVFRAR